MNEFLLSVSRIALLTFLITSMTAVGLSLTMEQIVAPLRRIRLVCCALLANFIVVPLVAVCLAKLFRLEQPFASGLLLLGLAPGAPFLPKVVELAKADRAFSVGLMGLLMAGSVVFLPVVLPVVVPTAEVGAWQIARPLLLLMALPLTGGLLLKRALGGAVDRLLPGLRWLSNVSLAVVLTLVVALNLPSVLRVLGTGAIAAAILLTLIAGLAGNALGGPEMSLRRVMVLGTGFRNIAAALVVGEEDFKDPQVVVMLVIGALAGVFLLMPLTLTWGKRSAQLGPALVAHEPVALGPNHHV